MNICLVILLALVMACGICVWALLGLVAWLLGRLLWCWINGKP
jgi:hypothetical protein